MHVAAAMGFEARRLIMQTAGTDSLEGFCLLVFQNSDKITAFLLTVQLTPMLIISMPV